MTQSSPLIEQVIAAHGFLRHTLLEPLGEGSTQSQTEKTTPKITIDL